MNKQQKLVLYISVLASFVAFLDSSVVGVALPAIAKELGGGLLLQQWVNDAYLISLGTLILAAGSLSDIFGRRKIITLGLYGFLAASLLCAVAPTSEFLVVSRGLQGVAGALLVPSSLAMIISTFSGSAQSKAIGQWTGWTGIAFIVGPLVGGLLVDSLSWRLIFAINILPVTAALVLLRFISAGNDIKTRQKVDLSGISLGGIGLAGVVYALIEQGRYSWASPIVYGAAGIGVLALAAFFVHERRTSQPMLPLGLFAVRNFSAGNIATFFIYAALALQGFLIVIFLQQVAGYSATQAGVASLPVTIIMFFLSSRFGALSGKYGPRIFMAGGPVIAGFGTLLLLGTQAHTNYWTQLLPGIILFGIGLAATVAPLTAAILGSIKASQAGIGSAVNNAVARIAGLVSVAVVGIFAGEAIDLQGFHAGIIACGTLLIAGGVVSVIGITNKGVTAPE